MTADDKIAELDRWLAERHLSGYWSRPEGEGGEQPKPHLWRWDEMYPALLRSGEMVPIGPRGMTEMRNVGLRNPGWEAMGKTISLGLQILMPGERTRAHRNLKNETRFVLKAPPGAVFIVEGEAFPMEEGDLVVTPTWTTHDHYNGGNEPAIWLDGLDMGLVSLGVEINDRYPEERPQQAVDKPAGYFAQRLGHARPPDLKLEEYARPPLRYPWRDTYSTLMALKEAEVDPDPCDGFHLTYTSPLDGGPTLPTFACEVQLLTAGMKTQAHRHNSTVIYNAFRGEGTTVVEGQRLEWRQGDMLVVPPWAWHHHENRSRDDAVLYSIDDRPAMTALGFYREEAAPGG